MVLVGNITLNDLYMICLSVALFVLMFKFIFTSVKLIAHPRLMLHCGIIWVLDFRHENNYDINRGYVFGLVFYMCML